MCNLSDRRCQFVIDNDQIVIRIERKFIRIERPLGLRRCRNQIGKNTWRPSAVVEKATPPTTTLCKNPRLLENC